MDKKINMEGEVISEVEVNSYDSRFKLRNQNQTYTVITSGMQAMKDYLFVRKGQRMEVEGKAKENVIVLESAKITLQLLNKSEESVKQIC